MQNIFSSIEDTRHQGYVKHKLADILVIVMCAVLSGLDELGTIMTFAENKAEFFKNHFNIDKIPSKPTVSRVLSLVDGEKVAKIIIQTMKESFGDHGEVLAVDGKAICSTSKSDQPHSALQIITAYLTESGVVLGQEKIHKKTNEIPVFQDMLSYLNVNGKTVTADAMHCQRDTCAKIIEKKGNYVFGLKENQPNLYRDIALFFESRNTNTDLECYTTEEKNGSRYEKRICRKLSDLSWLDTKNDWEGLRTAFSITRIVKKGDIETKEVSYYISSLDASPEKLLFLAREHWKIESMHWMLDAVFSEDSCALLTENGQITLNIFRKYALLLHKQYISSLKKKPSVRQNMLNCLMNDSLLIDIISRPDH